MAFKYFNYCITGNFGSDNVWRNWIDKVFSKGIDQQKKVNNSGY